MQHPEVIINGRRDEQVSSLDRGLLYGDGVFETIAVKNGVLLQWEDHLERLLIGCEKLGIQGLDAKQLEKEALQLLEAESDSKCVIKIIITRGIGDRGYKPTQQDLTRIVQKFPWPAHPASFAEEGVKVTQCTFRLAKQNKLAQIKHLNRLEQVLARSEWEDEFQEGLVCDTDDNIIEATSSNVFFQIDNTLVTPDLNQCGVAGVMRKKIIEYCSKKNVAMQIRDVKLTEIGSMQAMFLCNSVNGIWPVRSFCGRKLDKTAIIEQLIADSVSYTHLTLPTTPYV